MLSAVQYPMSVKIPVTLPDGVVQCSYIMAYPYGSDRKGVNKPPCYNTAKHILQFGWFSQTLVLCVGHRKGLNLRTRNRDYRDSYIILYRFNKDYFDYILPHNKERIRHNARYMSNRFFVSTGNLTHRRMEDVHMSIKMLTHVIEEGTVVNGRHVYK